MPERYPVFEARFGEDTFGNRFGYGIVVIYADVDWVSRAAPMQRRIAVSCLGDRTDVYRLDSVGERLRLNGANYVVGAEHIHGACGLGFRIRFRRDHATNVQHVVRPCNAVKHVFVARQIAPYYTHVFQLCVFAHPDSVFQAGPDKKRYVELAAAR